MKKKINKKDLCKNKMKRKNNKYIKCDDMNVLKEIRIIKGEDKPISEIVVNEVEMPNVLISLVESENKDYINMMNNIRILITNKRGMRNWREIPKTVEYIVITELYDDYRAVKRSNKFNLIKNDIIKTSREIDMIEYVEDVEKRKIIRGYIERGEIEERDSKGRNILEISLENNIKEESEEILDKIGKGKIKREIMEYIVKHGMDEVGEKIIDKMEEEEIKKIEGERVRYYMSYRIYGTMIKIMRIRRNKEEIEYLKYMIKMYEDDEEKKVKWMRECEEIKN